MTVPIALALLAVVAVAAFVLYPLVFPSRRSSSSLSLADELAARRAGLYKELLEIEFDYNVGKLSESDFRDLSQELLSKASTLLQQAEVADRELDARLEAEIAAARKTLVGDGESARSP